MFARIARLWSQFVRRAQTIDNEPLNKVSLIVLILIDIFIIINVFTGLNDISRWYISPSEAYPCYAEWNDYRTQTEPNKNYDILSRSLPYDNIGRLTFQQRYRQAQEGRLGNLSNICLNYAQYKDKVNNSNNQQIIKTIRQKQDKIGTLETANKNIRAQYDSSLLEKIAGQDRRNSIVQTSAQKAKQELDRNTSQITVLKKEITERKNALVAKAESVNFIQFLNDSAKFNELEKDYKRAAFWYPSIQLIFQTLFLLPLILLALLVHNFSQRKGYGLISLISWHLLVIFFIPLILKTLEFLQVGAVFKVIFDIISVLFGGLLFLISYIYILFIPLVGFGIIKFFQKFVFNSKVQVASRVQKLNCIKCAQKIRHHDDYCPYCGYYQYAECHNCHALTYRHLPYCKHCGHSQSLGNL